MMNKFEAQVGWEAPNHLGHVIGVEPDGGLNTPIPKIDSYLLSKAKVLGDLGFNKKESQHDSLYFPRPQNLNKE